MLLSFCTLILLDRCREYGFSRKLGKVENLLQRDPALTIELHIISGWA